MNYTLQASLLNKQTCKRFFFLFNKQTGMRHLWIYKHNSFGSARSCTPFLGDWMIGAFHNISLLLLSTQLWRREKRFISPAQPVQISFILTYIILQILLSLPPPPFPHTHTHTHTLTTFFLFARNYIALDWTWISDDCLWPFLIIFPPLY